MMPRATNKKETTTTTTNTNVARKNNGGTTTRKVQTTPHVNSDERYRMIQEAAYYKALHRNFQQGNPTHDWLMAEKEIDARLNHNVH